MNKRVLAALGGLLWIAFSLVLIFFDPDIRQNLSYLLIPAAAVSLMALSFIRLLQRSHPLGAGKIGAIVLLSGMGLIVLGMLVTAADFWRASFFLVIAGEMITTLGLAAFSLTTLSLEPAAFWKILPIIMAPIYFISWGPDPGNFPAWVPQHAEHWLAVVYGAGWILFGFVLPVEKSNSTGVADNGKLNSLE